MTLGGVHSRMLRAGAAVVLALTMGACGSTAVDTYDVSAVRSFPRHVGAGRGQLIIPEPTAVGPFATEKVVVRPARGQIAYLADAQWDDQLPKLLQARLVQSFENGSRLRGVGRPGDRLAADFQLMTDIRAFQLVITDQPLAEVEIAAKIVADRTGRIIAAKIFRATVPAAATAGPRAIHAIDEAFGQVATDIVLWASRII